MGKGKAFGILILFISFCIGMYFLLSSTILLSSNDEPQETNVEVTSDQGNDADRYSALGPDSTAAPISGYWSEQYINYLTQNPDKENIQNRISSANGQWYLDGKPSCVGAGSWNGDCDNTNYFCPGEGSTFGFGGQQLDSVQNAYNTPNKIHPSCPL